MVDSSQRARTAALVLMATVAQSSHLGCASSPSLDSGAGPDAGSSGDAGALPDGGSSADAGSTTDAGNEPDAGSGADGGLAASPFFGMVVNSPTTYPTVPYGVQRFWDTLDFQWSSLQVAPCGDIVSCDGGYDVAKMAELDAYLGHLPSIGVYEGIYTMASTPTFASAFPADATCHPDGGGACDRPYDLNDDGSGTNLTFRMWYAFFASHLSSMTSQGHAHVRYWEIWNEPDSPGFWSDGDGGHGSYAALVRMAEDMRCMLAGQGVVHNYPDAGDVVPCAQADLPAVGIDPTAVIVSPSYHATAQSLPMLQNFLYCNATPQVICNTGDAGAIAVDVINLHIKPGGGCKSNMANPPNCTPASSLEHLYTAAVQSVSQSLQPAERSKPLWNDEANYAEGGFAAPYTDPDMMASWIARFELMGWSLNVADQVWDPWEHLTTAPESVTAWTTVFEWMLGATLVTPCAPVGTTTVYTCGLSRAGTTYEVIWDIGQACGSGACTSTPQDVPTQYATYSDIAGGPASNVGECSGCGMHQVPVGLKPLLLSP
jgi:hypothetical protein